MKVIKKNTVFVHPGKKKICPLCLNLWCVDMFEKVAGLH